MAKFISIVKKITIIWIAGAFVSACAILDIKPSGGFPEMVDDKQDAPDLLSTDDYNFHDNPRL